MRSKIPSNAPFIANPHPHEPPKVTSLPNGLRAVSHTIDRVETASLGGASIAASVAFTSLSTAFNLFAMRRGALIVGADSGSLWKDLQSMPAILVAFIRAVGTAALTLLSFASRSFRS